MGKKVVAPHARRGAWQTLVIGSSRCAWRRVRTYKVHRVHAGVFDASADVAGMGYAKQPTDEALARFDRRYPLVYPFYQ